MSSRSSLGLAVAQPPVTPYDVAANVSAHVAAVAALDERLDSEIKVVAFPEMSLTGYHFDAPSVEVDDPRLLPLVEQCRRSNVFAFAGAPTADDSGRYISTLMFDGRADQGPTVAYRKMYLGSAEQSHFTAGSQPVVVEVGDWRLGLAICKDTGVPAHGAATVALGIDVYLAGALETVDDAHVQPERAQRVTADHRVWVAVACFAGSTGEGFSVASGGSGIWRPDGSEAARVDDKPGQLATAVIA